jgi:hypothetical protein
MFDVGRAVAVLVALVWSVRAGSRGGVVATLLIAYCYALEMASGLLAHAPAAAGYAFALVFIGPSSLPRGLALGWPLAGFVMRHPLAMQLVTAGCAALPWRMLERRSAKLYPESDEAVRVDRAAVQLVLVMTFDLILGGSQLMLALLARE